METPAFSFDRNEYQALLEALGRADTPANRFADNLERLGQAYQALGDQGERRLPADLRDHLDALVRDARALTRRLYALPDDAKALLTLHFVSEETSRRLLSDVETAIDPLADLIATASRLLAGELDGDLPTGDDPELVLLQAAERAYRNHFNIRVELGARARFRAAMKVFLGALANRDIGHAVRVLADLDQALEAAASS